MFEFWCKLIDDPAALSAIFISCLALIFTIYSGWKDRKHKQLTVRPLICGLSRTTHGSIELNLINNGFGPAILTNITYKTEMDLYTSPLYAIEDLISRHLGTKYFLNTETIYFHSINNHIIESNGGKIQIFKSPIKPFDHFAKKNYHKILSEMTITVKYKDLYGNSYTKIIDDEPL